jgi:hypothetical protein
VSSGPCASHDQSPLSSSLPFSLPRLFSLGSSSSRLFSLGFSVPAWPAIRSPRRDRCLSTVLLLHLCGIRLFPSYPSPPIRASISGSPVIRRSLACLSAFTWAIVCPKALHLASPSLLARISSILRVLAPRLCQRVTRRVHSLSQTSGPLPPEIPLSWRSNKKASDNFCHIASAGKYPFLLSCLRRRVFHPK